jgi:hypothetical protein
LNITSATVTCPNITCPLCANATAAIVTCPTIFHTNDFVYKFDYLTDNGATASEQFTAMLSSGLFVWPTTAQINMTATSTTGFLVQFASPNIINFAPFSESNHTDYDSYLCSRTRILSYYSRCIQLYYSAYPNYYKHFTRSFLALEHYDSVTFYIDYYPSNIVCTTAVTLSYFLDYIVTLLRHALHLLPFDVVVMARKTTSCTTYGSFMYRNVWNNIYSSLPASRSYLNLGVNYLLSGTSNYAIPFVIQAPFSFVLDSLTDITYSVLSDCDSTFAPTVSYFGLIYNSSHAFNYYNRFYKYFNSSIICLRSISFNDYPQQIVYNENVLYLFFNPVFYDSQLDSYKLVSV